MKKVTKAIIPAAGLGTRFLPQTKAMPKEMLPVVDKPVIQYVVEECVSAGIEDIVIVTGWSKRAIEDHFDVPNGELVSQLKTAGKTKLLEEVTKISQAANFIYVRQKGPYGNGTPILSAQAAIGDESFAVLWGDEFIYSTPSRLTQMLEVHRKYGGAVISAVRIKNKNDLSRYGIADVQKIEGNVFKIKKIVEKPDPDEAPSNLAAHGAYVLPPDIFAVLKEQKPGKGGEIWLPEAIDTLIKSGFPVFACEIENARYYDTGNKLEYLKTVVEFALKHSDLNGDFRSYLKSLKL